MGSGQRCSEQNEAELFGRGHETLDSIRENRPNYVVVKIFTK